MTHIFSNSNSESCEWLIYMICISFERKFYDAFNTNKNFEIRPRKICFLPISRKCVGGKFFRLKIRNQKKILHRMIYHCIWFIFKFIVFWGNNSFYAYAFREDIENTMNMNINHIPWYIIRCEIFFWFRIFSRKNFPLTHFWDIGKKQILRGRISKFLFALKAS